MHWVSFFIGPSRLSFEHEHSKPRNSNVHVAQISRRLVEGPIAAEHGLLGRHRVVNLVRDHASGHRELDGRRVDDAHNVARAGCRDGAEKGALGAVLGVELDNLLVVVGTLEQLDTRVERPAIGLQEHLQERKQKGGTGF